MPVKPGIPAAPGATDHGALTGLADDDHPQYLLAPVIVFTHANFPSMILRAFVAGEHLKKIVIKVLQAFNGSPQMSIGYPADNDEIAQVSEIDLTQLDAYEFDPLRLSAVSETLTAYFSGSPTQGQGHIYLYK